MIYKIPTNYPLQLWQFPYLNQHTAPLQIENALKYYREQLDSLLENITIPNSSIASLPTTSTQISESLNLLAEVLDHSQMIENTSLRVFFLDKISKCYAKLERIKAYIQQRDQKLLSQQVHSKSGFVHYKRIPETPQSDFKEAPSGRGMGGGRDQDTYSTIGEEAPPPSGRGMGGGRDQEISNENCSETPQESKAETKPPITNYQLPITNSKKGLIKNGDIIVLGKHHFQINQQPLDLTLVPYEQNGEKKIAIHLLGTDFFEVLNDEALNATQAYWDQSIVSESNDVYRGEYLAVSLLLTEEFAHLKNLRDLTHDDLLEQVRRYIAEHDDKAYELGIHDVDATLILEKLLYIPSNLGLLGFEPSCRAIAQLFWAFYSDKEQLRIWETTVKTLQQLQTTFGSKGQLLAEQLTSEISQAIEDFLMECHFSWMYSRFLPPSPAGGEAPPPSGRGMGGGRDQDTYSTIGGEAPPPSGRGMGGGREPDRYLITSNGKFFTQQKKREIADYLIEELKNDPINFTVSTEAMQLVDGFQESLEASDNSHHFEENLRALRHNLNNQITLAYAGITSYATQLKVDLSHYYLEAVSILLTGKRITRQVNPTKTHVEVTQLMGQHPRIKDGTLLLQIDEFLERTQHFINVHVPAFHAYQQLRQQVIEREKKRLHLEEFKAQPLTTFVHNRLINEVYLNFIGDNFAKQIGTIEVQNISENGGIGVQNLFWNQTNSGIGVQNLFWNQGMLLLLSPAGYGKTTLMEYLAHHLGFILIKIDGATLGEQITSLDPAQAPNLIVRQELEKLNFALQLANNVMLYLDNIQHSHPAFLQKFTTLADTQRKIDGVWQGKPKTYHLRGKRFCLVMAGNPYANSGECFQIPEALANRADIYRLGTDINGISVISSFAINHKNIQPISRRSTNDTKRSMSEQVPYKLDNRVNHEEDVFALSYIENALSIHPVLAPLIKPESDDLEKFIRLIQSEDVSQRTSTKNPPQPPFTKGGEFSYPYSSTELEEITAILKNLFRLQKLVLKINLHYIASATQADQYRAEPPFKLQGSYHDMNQMATKVVANMRDEALENLIDAHYVNQAQVLGADAEVNLLKLAEIRGTLTTAQAARWKEIKRTFKRLQNKGTETGEVVARIVAHTQIVSETLQHIHQLIDKITQQPDDSLVEEVQHLNTSLATLPKLVNTLSNLEFNVINQPASGLESSLKQMIEMVDQTLLPIVQDFERKSKLDLMIFERLKDVGDTLKGLQKELTTSEKKHKIYKALSFK